MRDLPRCTLCPELSDPRWSDHVDGVAWPMCDGCSPDPFSEEDRADTFAVVRALRDEGKRQPNESRP